MDLSSKDCGSSYEYYVEATEGNSGEKLQSNTVRATLTTGLKGYSILVDQNKDTIPDNSIETTDNHYTITLSNALEPF